MSCCCGGLHRDFDDTTKTWQIEQLLEFTGEGRLPFSKILPSVRALALEPYWQIMCEPSSTMARTRFRDRRVQACDFAIQAEHERLGGARARAS